MKMYHFPLFLSFQVHHSKIRMAVDKQNRLNPRPEPSVTISLPDLDAPRLSPGNESDPSILVNGSLIQDGLLGNSTHLGGAGHNTRMVHMQPRVTANNHPPQYGSFFTPYDPMTGARTAAILGSFLLMLVFYIIYKAKCHQPWTDEDDYYLQQYKQRQANKATNQQQPVRRGTSYIIDPVCSPDPKILAATAQWVQMQPLETALPDPAAAGKKRNRLALSKFPSFSAERINRQLLHAIPLVPNGHGPPPDDSPLRERSCNEYVPNGFLKYIHKDSIHGPDWLYNDTLLDSPPGDGRVEFYIEEEERHHHRRRASSVEDIMYTERDQEVDDLFSDEQQHHKPRKKSGKHKLEQCTSLDRHNNNAEDLTLPLDPTVEICTNCLSDRSSGNQDLQTRAALFLPPNREILLTPTPRSSRLRSKSKQRSRDRASLESHQPSIEDDDDLDDSTDFCISILPARDAAPGSLDINDFSSNETTSDHHIPSASISNVPILSYIDNLANNSTFSTMSTATASSNGSYQSEGGPDIPLTHLVLASPPGAEATPQPNHTVEVSIETALESSSTTKTHDEMDTNL